MQIKFLGFCAVVLMFLGGPAWAGDVFVIANADVFISAEDIRDVFTGEKQLAGKVKLVPMDNAAVAADFLAKVVRLEATKYASVWTKKGFRDGVSPPPVRSNDAEIINAIKSTPGAVGYVSKVPADIKIIQKY